MSQPNTEQREEHGAQRSRLMGIPLNCCLLNCLLFVEFDNSDALDDAPDIEC